MYAPYTNDRRVTGQGLVRGCFEVSETSAFFEWADRADSHYWPGADAIEWPHVIFTADGTRVCKVMGTRVRVAIGEAPNGAPVAETWRIKARREYDVAQWEAAQ